MNPYPSDPPLGSSGENRWDRVFGPSGAYVSRSVARHPIRPTRRIADAVVERSLGRRGDLGDHDRARRRCSSGTRNCHTGPWSFAADADRGRPRARAAAASAGRVAPGNRSRGVTGPNQVLWTSDYSNRGRSGSPDQSRSSRTASTWCTWVRPGLEVGSVRHPDHLGRAVVVEMAEPPRIGSAPHLQG
jgi:hypothetical protein